MNSPKNLLEVYQLYSKYLETIHDSKTLKNILNEIRSALLRFLLVGLGAEIHFSSKKMTFAEVELAKKLIEVQPVSKLLVARTALEEGLEKLGASKASRNTYGRRLEQLLIWSEQQLWWPDNQSDGANPKNKYCPKIRKGNGKVSASTLTERNSMHCTYQLQPEEISLSLAAELKNFYEYLSSSEWPGRLTKPIAVSSASWYLKQIRLILGWFYRYQGIALEELNLDLLIPKITSESLSGLTPAQKQELWSNKKLVIDTWICNYLKFLREKMESFSPRTKKTKMDALSALNKFIYHEEVYCLKDYNNIPIAKVISKHSRNISKEIKEWSNQKRYVVSQDQKWPETLPGKTALTTVRQQILEPLRQECRFKYDNWHTREGNTIAMSLQRYLVWSFLADMPPRRQEEYRSLQISLYCPILRPSDVPADGLYHPLLPDEVRLKDYNCTFQDNYLYKTYTHKGKSHCNGIWVLNIQKYKTAKTYGPQSIIIPNREFTDGTCLYDYIERYLYGWWMPGVSVSHQVGQQGEWLTAGRACFSPSDTSYISNRTKSNLWSWGYFFIKPVVGLSYNTSNFKDVVTVAAHRLTGKRLTPHTLRYIWATWAFQVGLTDHQKESLAYAMGHDIKTLLEMYDKCTPDEKRRPIEEAIDTILFKAIEQEQQPSSSTDDVEELASHLKQLSEADLQQFLEKFT